MENNLLPQPKKGNSIIYVVLLVVIISLMVVLKYCSGKTGSTNNDSAVHSDTLIVAIEYSPLSCYTYDDTLGGFCYDAVRLMAHYAHCEVKFCPLVTLGDALNGLNKGKYDLLIAQFPVTKENRADYIFSDALYLDRQVLVQRADTSGNVKVKTQLDLAGKTVCVVKGSPMRDRIESLSREIGDSIKVCEDAVYGPEQLFMRVAAGEIDYAVINESVARSLAMKYKNVNIDTDISFTQFQSMIMRKDNDALCDSVNRWLKAIKRASQFRSLEERYNLTK